MTQERMPPDRRETKSGFDLRIERFHETPANAGKVKRI